MAWPSGQDFNEAIQAPALAFADADLRSGTVECNQFGLPRPRTGAFATVYKVTNGNRAWAVRCFNRELKDQQERYQAISADLNQRRLPYMVGFVFLTDGIRVKGAQYPILKMEWVTGEPLHVYIERNLNNAPVLLD